MNFYKLSSKADEDVFEIYNYGIDKFGVSVAESYLKGLHNVANQLIFKKELWRRAFDLSNGLYKYIYNSHVIFFTVEEKSIFIIRVLQKNMDFERHI